MKLPLMNVSVCLINISHTLNRWQSSRGWRLEININFGCVSAWVSQVCVCGGGWVGCVWERGLFSWSNTPCKCWKVWWHLCAASCGMSQNTTGVHVNVCLFDVLPLLEIMHTCTTLWCDHYLILVMSPILVHVCCCSSCLYVENLAHEMGNGKGKRSWLFLCTVMIDQQVYLSQQSQSLGESMFMTSTFKLLCVKGEVGERERSGICKVSETVWTTLGLLAKFKCPVGRMDFLCGNYRSQSSFLLGTIKKLTCLTM